jgi:hypothetical protein
MHAVGSFVCDAGGAIMVGLAQWVVYHNYFGLASKAMTVQAGDKRPSIMRELPVPAAYKYHHVFL